MKKLILLTILASLAIAAPADDVMDWIDDGVTAYKAKDYSEAITNLEYAAQLIRQLKGDALTGAMPSPLSGWKQVESEGTAVGAAMFGGSTGASARYEKGNSWCDIQITTDNPMLAGMAMMFSNPMMLTASGQKLIKIGGEKAALDYDKDDRSGEITFVIAQNVLVQISGGEISEDDLRAYAKAIDFGKIEKMTE